MEQWVWILFVFVLYFAVLIGVAVYRTPRMGNMSDYVLGGRRVGGFTTALSAGSSSASGWTMLVFPALAFAGGMMHLWTVATLVLGAWLTWVVVAKRLRRYTLAAGDSLTIPEFWEKRFDDRSGVLRGLAALISLYFIALYVCSGLIAGAKLLEEVFDLDHTGTGHDIAVFISLVAVLSYTFIGGFLAVSRTDVFQALIMLGGIMIIPISLIFIADNPFQALETTPSGFWNPLTDADGATLGWQSYLSALGWGIGAFGSLRILARFMAIKDEKDIPGSTRISIAWTVLMFGFGLLMGLVAVPALASQGVDLPDPERLYLTVSSVFFHPVIGGLLLTGVVAAVMSTADSQLLLASAIASADLPWLSRITNQLGTRGRVMMGRLMLVTVGLVAALISILAPDSVYALVSLAWGGMGAAFGPVIVLSLYWKRFNLAGAYAGLITGTLVSTVWWLMDLGNQGILGLAESLGFQSALTSLQEVGVWQINPAVPGMVIGGALSIIVTLATRPPSQEVQDLFEQVVGVDKAGSKEPEPQAEGTPATGR